MKINLYIEADDRVSLFCNGWVADEDSLSGQGPFQIKLGNPAIAGLVTGQMPCRIETAGKPWLKGSICKSERVDFFIIKKESGNRRSS